MREVIRILKEVRIIRKNKSIVLSGVNSKDEVLSYLRKRSKKYNWFNCMTQYDSILVKEKNGIISVVISKKVDQREFEGKIYNEDGKTFIEGSFKLTKAFQRHIILGAVLMLLLFIAICYYALDFNSLIGPEMGFILGYVVVIIGSMIFGIRYHSKRYEDRILNFLEQSLTVK